MSFYCLQIIWQSWHLSQLCNGSAWPNEQGKRQKSGILIENVEDVKLMDEIVEDVNKAASPANSYPNEKDTEEVLPE